jgi:hypothetical protein
MSSAHNPQLTASLVRGAQRTAPVPAGLALARVAVFSLARSLAEP